ncbi:MAG: hypothetical protein SOW18_01270 [Peptoniphilus sp.]|nr:hypothetical protein [Peptoniphilus sp.]MDY3118151.1 hypothetical protein [Peptoniphilus sp.]
MIDNRLTPHLILKPGAVVDPTANLSGTENFPTVIGAYTVVEAGVQIRGANIGNYATLRANSAVEEGVYIGDYAIVEENTRLPTGAKVPSRAVVSGDPFSIVRGLTREEIHKAETRPSEAL